MENYVYKNHDVTYHLIANILNNNFVSPLALSLIQVPPYLYKLSLFLNLHERVTIFAIKGD